MPAGNDTWGNLNTLLEIGIELYRMTRQTNSVEGVSKDVAVEQMAEGVLLIADDQDVLIAVCKGAAKKA
jgi:hypothetical protein